MDWLTDYKAPLLRKLERLGPLSSEERRMLEELPHNEMGFSSRRNLIHEGDPPSDCMVLLNGLTCRYKNIGNGRRQIVNFNIPGDILGLASMLLRTLDHSVCALTPVRVAVISNANMLDLTERSPQITRLLWRDTLVEAAVFREQAINIGRRSAYERTAHLLCELVSRLRAVGLAQDDSYALPITQSDLGDALGLTPVHVNRTLQKLRGSGLIELHHRTLVILDWPGLKQAAGFDPAYLYELAEGA